jgi:type IV pilus assembly protein PilY1
MKFFFGAIALVVSLGTLPGLALADPTSLATVPLLSMDGTGTVKPNLMLLYDNSGSMVSNYTPDYIADGTTCRSRATLALGRRSCTVGQPPFNSPEFNRQYYDPSVLYTPPVDAAGNSYKKLTAGETANWTLVPTDGFSVNKVDLIGATSDFSNLATKFPDLEWCDGNGNCKKNTATYDYPDNTYITPSQTTGNPYYYSIRAAEYCKDKNLTVCITTAVDATAPAGYPFPAKIRWCDSSALTNCQAKFSDTKFLYPRFSSPNGGAVSFGTVKIEATTGTTAQPVDNVSVLDNGTVPVVITNGTVTASSGTNTNAKMIALAQALAASIVAKNGLARQYTACVYSPSNGSGVPSCASLGISVPNANTTVAIVPLSCAAGETNKSRCTVLSDTSRNGWGITVNSARVQTTVTLIGAGADVFVRTDIVSGKTYPKALTRTDCAGTLCTYNEEMTNFANWYSYYRTRNQMMKTSVGLAFQSINSNFNVGIVSLSDANGGGSSGMIRPALFEATARSNWYAKLYAMNGSSTTPLRAALHNVGRMYANQGNYQMAAGKEVVFYPCQQNYTFLTTDGYWNGGVPDGVADNDKVESESRFCLAATGCVDKKNGSTAGSLADTALYWYNGGSNAPPASGYSSLRPTLEGAKGAVLGRDGENTRLHMNTYTLGLGVDGVMTYEDNYDTNPEPGGDFYNLTHGVATGCPWNNDGEYVWPDPLADDNAGSVAYQTRVDDLWHAAINGHGKYFRASNPTQVVTGLRSALTNIKAQVGAAAASATSTPNLSQTDNDIFSTTFTTVQWSGELTDKKLDPITGVVEPDVMWTSNNTVGTKVAAATDTRKILMLDTAKGGFKNFKYDVMSALEQGWFKDKCSLLAQCSGLSIADRATVNNGATIVDWLRGQQQYANDVLLRAYSKTKDIPAGQTAQLPIVLGDIASSKPAYVRDPRKFYDDATYAAFKSRNKTRQPMVYVGSNDGMLHAFNATTGEELWAYVPRITMKKLYVQAGTTYNISHQYSVDGSPEVVDVKIGNVWKTVLVSGLGAGGRGYFALDVTDPAAPAPLWETCAEAAICAGVNNEPQLGLTFGNPQIGTWVETAGTEPKWVAMVTSGYNNIPADNVNVGNGQGWLMLLDIATGKVLKKVSTGYGDADTPSGLARISAITSDPNYSAQVQYVFGGDNDGKMFRFDLTSPGNIGVVKMGDAGTAQPITTRPEATYCAVVQADKDGNEVTTSQLMVAFGTGRMLNLADLKNEDVQSLYVLKDGAAGISAAEWRGASMARQALTKNTSEGKADTYTTTGTAADLLNQKGWYVDFSGNKREKVNLDPQIVQGAINVITNIPDTSTSCKVGGSSVAYAFNVCSGLVGADGIAGRPVNGSAGTAGFILVSTSSGELKIEAKLVDGSDITLPAGNVKTPVIRRAGWRRIRN